MGLSKTEIVNYNGKYLQRPNQALIPCFVKVIYSSFINLNCPTDGGALFIKHRYNGAKIEVIRSSFYKCETKITGGAIFFLGQESLMKENSFAYCYAHNHYHSVRITLEPQEIYLNHFNDSLSVYCSERNWGCYNVGLIFGQIHSKGFNGTKNIAKWQASNMFMMSSRGYDSKWEYSNSVETCGHYSNYFNGQKKLYILFCNFIGIYDSDRRYGLIRSYSNTEIRNCAFMKNKVTLISCLRALTEVFDCVIDHPQLSYENVKFDSSVSFNQKDESTVMLKFNHASVIKE